MPYRILITTHHITSRAKIQSLIRAAEAHRVSAVLKTTIKPPGVMICEGDVESDARAWLAFVRTRRYKGLRFMKGEDVAGPRTVNDGKDGVKITEVYDILATRARMDSLPLKPLIKRLYLQYIFITALGNKPMRRLGRQIAR
ncbi:MAG: hypothetical protein LQ340_004163 [Diploschistes diacapsis]|nr:MAG: hypothetical protein LQ340_004163 [Diploschistes diacapsis]